MNYARLICGGDLVLLYKRCTASLRFPHFIYTPAVWDSLFVLRLVFFPS